LLTEVQTEEHGFKALTQQRHVTDGQHEDVSLAQLGLALAERHEIGHL
jgi:hypothetical protein